VRLSVAAIGRIKTGPERALCDDYRARADAAGRALGLGPVAEREIDGRRLATAAAETAALLDSAPSGAKLIVMDERGAALPSRAFADRLAAWRDSGARETVFLIGGADGMTEAARSRADMILAFGPATWPHRLARIMLYEQIYRAFTILGGSAYHKE
jgi:23S rRNA (pseudouridine1915-N3)-methyltransferase